MKKIVVFIISMFIIIIIPSIELFSTIYTDPPKFPKDTVYLDDDFIIFNTREMSWKVKNCDTELCKHHKIVLQQLDRQNEMHTKLYHYLTRNTFNLSNNSRKIDELIDTNYQYLIILIVLLLTNIGVFFLYLNIKVNLSKIISSKVNN